MIGKLWRCPTDRKKDGETGHYGPEKAKTQRGRTLIKREHEWEKAEW